MGKAYAADSLCTWNQYHERINGLMDTFDTQNACDWVDCLFIPVIVHCWLRHGGNQLLAHPSQFNTAIHP